MRDGKEWYQIGETNFRWPMTGTPISGDYIKPNSTDECTRLMAIVAESERGRVFLSLPRTGNSFYRKCQPEETRTRIRRKKRDQYTYGMKQYRQLFTPRQLITLTTFSDLLQEVRKRVERDIANIGLPDNGQNRYLGNAKGIVYGDAVILYLAMAIDRMANTLTMMARWTPERQQTVTAFARQALQDVGFSDVNPFSNAAGDYGVSLEGV
jgi:putative DNA methylase